MAQKTSVVLIDDLDGGEADESVAFGLDGVEYDIDLSAANAKKLRDGLADFLAGARRVGRMSSARRASTAPAKRASAKQRPAFAYTRAMNGAIREWAKKQGIPVSDRGRISAEVLAQYEEAHPEL